MESKYFISYTIYYGCPTCDGNGWGDLETISLSPLFDNIVQLVNYIKNNIGEYFLVLYSLDAYGDVTKVCDITMINGGHRTHGASFNLEGHTYTITTDKVESTNETFNILYGK